MGKKRIVKKEGGTATSELKSRSLAQLSRKKLSSVILHIEATFNNTKVTFSDKGGQTIFWISSGSLGFKGVKKSTPFVASKIGDLAGEKAKSIGIKEADIIIKGVGSGREPTIRAFMAHGIELTSIKDKTPIPHNGPKRKKPRRV